mmetsp:Transcript_35031/g.69143  ORF Transcript_35031/g.69143 Transcript_35031/m.69143 type:complete len:86 (+) Transcript_35031:363-620(+)
MQFSGSDLSRSRRTSATCSTHAGRGKDNAANKHATPPRTYTHLPPPPLFPLSLSLTVTLSMKHIGNVPMYLEEKQKTTEEKKTKD